LVEAERKIVEQKQAIVQRQEGFVPASSKALPSPSLAQETEVQRVERLKSEWTRVKEDEKKKLASYWASKSWQAWNWNQLIEAWEATKGKSFMFKARMVVLKLLEILWDFVPFFLMAWIIMVILYFALTGMFVAAEYIRLSRVLLPIALPLVVLYYWYSDIDVLQLTVSLLVFFTLIVALEVFLRDFYLLVSPSYLAVFVDEAHQRRLIRLQGVVENKSSLNDLSIVKQLISESRPLLPSVKDTNSYMGLLNHTIANKVLPYIRTSTLLHILPYIMMVIMGAASMLTALGSSIITTCLFSARYVVA
jgi:hypothetical protein